MWKQRDLEKWDESVFRLIGTRWMLITAGNAQHFNTMTASWGGLGILWNRPVATVYVRPTRFTDSFVKRYEGFTLSFFKEQYREALNICGRLSGRDVDKVSVSGLTPVKLKDGRMTFSEANLVLSCRKVYGDIIKPSNILDHSIERHYPRKDYHCLYIGEITAFLENSSAT